MGTAVKTTGAASLTLPASLVGRADIVRVLREIEELDNDLTSQAIREPGKPLTVPSLSKSVSELVELNGIALTDQGSRTGLVANMRLAKNSPSVQLTFATEPEIEVVIDLVAWIRTHLHPAALVIIGLQPAIVGGCVVRTPDHIYDFSMRAHFKAALPTLASDLARLAQN